LVRWVAGVGTRPVGRPETPDRKAAVTGHTDEPWSRPSRVTRAIGNSDFSMGAGYSLASATGARGIITPPEICDAIRNAATTAGTLINLRN
jgi:hypothetical protein